MTSFIPLSSRATKRMSPGFTRPEECCFVHHSAVVMVVKPRGYTRGTLLPPLHTQKRTVEGEYVFGAKNPIFNVTYIRLNAAWGGVQHYDRLNHSVCEMGL